MQYPTLKFRPKWHDAIDADFNVALPLLFCIYLLRYITNNFSYILIKRINIHVHADSVLVQINKAWCRKRSVNLQLPSLDWAHVRTISCRVMSTTKAFYKVADCLYSIVTVHKTKMSNCAGPLIFQQCKAFRGLHCSMHLSPGQIKPRGEFSGVCARVNHFQIQV